MGPTMIQTETMVNRVRVFRIHEARCVDMYGEDQPRTLKQEPERKNAMYPGGKIYFA